MKKLSLLLTALTVLLLSTQAVSADQYEGDKPSAEILIDKQVCSPFQNKGGDLECTYVENLSTTDYRYSPLGYVFFRLRVKNTSTKVLNAVTIKDVAPDYVDLYENPGKLDGRTLVIDAGNFAAGEEKVFTVRSRVQSQDKMPSDKGLICVVNKATASNSDASDEDSSQFCIEKEVEQVSTPGPSGQTKGGVPKKVPSAGAEHGMLITALSGALGYFGLKLRRIRG